MKDLNEYKDRLMAVALEQGCSAAEVCVEKGETFSVGVLKGEIDTYSVSEKFALGLRVQFDGKNGYADTELPEDAESLVQAAMDNARSVQSEDEHPMQGAQTYEAVPEKEDALRSLSTQEKIALCQELERRTLALDSRVQRVESCMVIHARGTVGIYNTRGLCAQKEQGLSLSYVTSILAQGGDIKDGFAFRADKDVLDLAGCAQEAVQEAAAKFGASPVPTGKYRVLLRNDVAAGLLGAFSGMFSADAAQKGLSLLRGREGEAIAAPCISIEDNPFYSINAAAFDDEGTPSIRKKVVEGGVLKTLLHNLKTAKKAGVASTSNGGRNGVGAPVDVRPTNLYICEGEKDYAALCTELGDGILLTDTAGIHAGVNPVSGEFSLLCRGHLFQGGKPVRPVEQITVGGNFLDLLKNVVYAGADIRFSMPAGSCFGSPSLLVKSLSISGK